MHDPAPKKVSGWKIAGIVLGATLLAAAVLAVGLGMAGTAKFGRMIAMADARRAEMKARDPARPVLRGSPEPGNAWDDYLPAMDAVQAYPGASKLGEIVTRGPKADPELGKAALAALAKAVEQVQRGAHRATSRYPYEWDKGLAMPIPHLSTASQTGYLVALQARALSEEGKGRESAGLLLDALQFGRDMGGDGVLLAEMIGYATMGTALEEIRSQLAAGKFDQAALGDLDRGLAALEPILPDHARTLVNDLVLLGGMTDPSISGSWGPMRLLYANAVEQTTDMMTRAAKADTVSWAESLKVSAQIEQEAKDSWNPVTKLAVPSSVSSSRNIRVRRAQLRMLRVAIHRAATGELLDLDDPFGAKLKTLKTGEGLKIWSVGPDGVDDGGSGEWKNEGKDLVLQLKQ